MPPTPSSDRVALVTGASAGIGEAIARRLLADGWTVYGAARRLDRMEDLAAGGARVLELDLTDEPSMKAAFKVVRKTEGRLDALVNNAGYGSYGALEDVPLDEARRQFEVNVFGLVRFTQLFLPMMREAGRGTIVNVSSMGGRAWFPFGGWYHATKHSLEVLSDVLRHELKPFGVRVVVVQPGSIKSEWGGIAARGLRERSRKSPYADAAEPWARIMENPEQGADPDVISKLVAKALTSDKPRRRYTAPMDAKSIVFLKRWMTEGAWERFVDTSIHHMAKNS